MTKTRARRAVCVFCETGFRRVSASSLMLKGTSMSSDAIAEKKYRINYGTAMNVHEIDETGRVKLGLCFAPKGSLVTGDVMLAQKIALETFERRALAVANRCLIVDLQLRSNASRAGRANAPRRFT